MSYKVVCFASAKGGTGKTIATASIGTFLAGLGKRVLLVDTDASTNGLTLLYLKEVAGSVHALGKDFKQPAGVFDTEKGLGEVSRLTLPSGVDLIPATYYFNTVGHLSKDDFSQRLATILEKCRDEYDYILLDAEAGADAFAAVAMSKNVSDLVVLVTEYDPMSAAGIERLKGLMRDELTYPRTWILLNKILPEFARNYSDFLQVAQYLSPIPWDADVVRAYARRRLALDTERGNAFTLAVMQTIRSLFADDIENQMTAWTESRAEAIRQPIKHQYDELEHELKEIMFDWMGLEQSMKRVETMRFATAAFVAAVLFLASTFFYLQYVRVLNIIYLASLSTLFLLGILAYVYFVRLRRPFDREFEKAKLERRRAVIESQLRRLETLRAADAESLIRETRSK